MLQIKSAQYMRMPMPKALPEEQSDSQLNMAVCKMCKEPKVADHLDDGFCQKCLIEAAKFGTIKMCNNCQRKYTEEEVIETEDGPVCRDCSDGNYHGGRYIGPRNTHTDSYEGYE